jgi:hypothetical protein
MNFASTCLSRVPTAPLNAWKNEWMSVLRPSLGTSGGRSILDAYLRFKDTPPPVGLLQLRLPLQHGLSAPQDSFDGSALDCGGKRIGRRRQNLKVAPASLPAVTLYLKGRLSLDRMKFHSLTLMVETIGLGHADKTEGSTGLRDHFLF